MSAREQRALVVLGEQTALSDPRLESVLTVGARSRGGPSGRVGGLGAALGFLAGVALMLTTFAQWPVVAVVGLIIQLVALRLLLQRFAPRVGAVVRRWSEGSSSSPDHPSLREGHAK